MATMLPSQVQRLPLNVELAFGADLNTGFLSWPWAEYSDRLDAQTITPRGGRADWGSRVQPSTVGFRLANHDGRLTPGNPTSDLYPDVVRGTPCRLTIPGTDPYLLTDGDLANNASTPDHASLQITGDIDLRYDGDIDWMRGALGGVGGVALNGRYKASSNRRSYLLWLSGGRVLIAWSTDGTAAGAHSVGSSRAVPWAKGRHAVRATLQVSSGGNHIVTFYTAATGASPWDQLEAPIVLPGTTSIHAGTAPLEVGVVTEEITAPPRGKNYGAEVLSGIAGSSVANPNFAAQPEGTTGFVDAAGRTWALNGAAEITARRVWFFGQVDEIAPQWPHGDLSGPDPERQPGEAVVDISASGTLRRLGQGNKPLGSTLRRAVTSPKVAANVIAYWPMEDDRGSTSFASPIAGVQPMGFGGDLQLASDDQLPASQPLPNVAGGKPGGWAGIVPPRTVTQWRTDFLLRIPTPVTSPAETPLIAISTSGTVARWTFAVNQSVYTLRGFDATGTQIFTDSRTTSQFFDGWTHLSIAVTQNGGNLNVDVLRHSVSGDVFGFSLTPFAGTIGSVTSVGNLFASAPPDGFSFGQVVVTTGLGGTWLGWAGGANRAYAGELAAVRLQRLSAEEGIKALVVGDPTVSQPMGPQRPRPLLDLFYECADADLGILHDRRDADGVTYRTGASILNQPPTVELDAAVNEIAAPFAPVLDDHARRNDITVKRDGGSSARATTDPPPPPDDLYDEEITVNVESDDQLPSIADWRLHLGTWPGMRYPTVTSELTAAPRLLDLWPDLDLGDRITVRNLPPQHPTNAVDLLVEGFAEAMSPTLWTPQLNCSSAGPWDIGVLDSDVHRLDTDGSALHTAIDSSAISLDVASTVADPTTGIAKPLWTTNASHFDFDATLGGEVVTVTDIDPALVTFGAAGTAAHAVNADVTPGVPAGIVAGNLLVVFAAIRNSGNFGAGIPSTPAGYVRLPAFPSTSNAQLFAKVAVGGDPAPTISFTGGVANADTSAQMIRLGGNWHDPANIAAAYNHILSNSSQQDIPYPRVHVPVDNCIILYAGWKQDDWTSVATIAGATEIGEPSTTTGDDQGLAWDYVIQTAAATIPAGSFVVTGGAAAISRGAVIALRCDRQTFTVARATNGVEKSHAAGTAVQVAHPLRAGF